MISELSTALLMLEQLFKEPSVFIFDNAMLKYFVKRCCLVLNHELLAHFDKEISQEGSLDRLLIYERVLAKVLFNSEINLFMGTLREDDALLIIVFLFFPCSKAIPTSHWLRSFFLSLTVSRVRYSWIHH